MKKREFFLINKTVEETDVHFYYVEAECINFLGDEGEGDAKLNEEEDIRFKGRKGM